MEDYIRTNREHRAIAADFCAANPGQNVTVGTFRRDAAGHESMVGGEAWVEQTREPEIENDHGDAAVGIAGLIISAGLLVYWKYGNEIVAFFRGVMA